MNSETNNPQPLPPISPVTTQASAMPRRAPGLALVLSFFPGLGHLYLGLYQRAMVIFLCFATAIWLAEHSSLGILVAFVWFFAVIDGYRQAQALNLGLVPEPILGDPKQKTAKRGSLGFGIFLVVLGVILFYRDSIDFTWLEDYWPMLLVVAGAYLLGAHFWEQAKQRKKDLEAELPSPDPGTSL
jgi:Domain of unknown function (DUF5668)